MNVSRIILKGLKIKTIVYEQKKNNFYSMGIRSSLNHFFKMHLQIVISNSFHPYSPTWISIIAQK